MILSRRWLEALLGRALDAAEVARWLSARCAAVDAVIPVHQELEPIQVGRVVEVRKHPNADRLSLCLVDHGAPAPVEVVCGAPNVQAGKRYPYAPVGAVLPGGGTLARRAIRGVESNGMLCSAKELGLGEDSGGILELDTTAAPGTPLVDALGLGDHQIVLDVNANRPDLLCHKGVARELAPLLDVAVKLPSFPDARATAAPTRPDRSGGPERAPLRRTERGLVDGVEVRLEDPEGAPRYFIAVIRGVRVGPSPLWLAERLRAVGQRPINNVVDATNYVLFELNQPLHAFDLAKLRGPAVVVRRARALERMVTLDGVTRTLNPDMTVIADAERPTIVAGVMGSAESQVSSDTTDLVLECAYFQPTRIRRTRKALELSSDSSYRFERGIDMLAMPAALSRAIELLLTVAGGSQREPPLELWPTPVAERTVFLRPERVARLLGVAVERAAIERYLVSVGFVVAPKDGRLAVQIPGWRPDVVAEVDLIEEVARLKGYDTFPDELRPYRPGRLGDAPEETARDRVREALVRAGCYEARTLPLGPADGPDAVAILNPLSAEEAHLRRRLLPGLIRRVEHNWANRTRDVRLFEVGTVFRQRVAGGAAGPGAQPALEEWTSVAAVLTGARRPPHWSEGAKVPDIDLWDLKHHFELALDVAAPGAGIEPAPENRSAWVARRPARAPGSERSVGESELVGWAGPLAADRPPWAAPLYGFEVRLFVAAARPRAYRPLPVQPPVEEDLALVLPAGVSAAAVEAVLRRGAGALLERLEVFDEYRGPGIPAGARSVAWHCTFRDPARTLRDGEVKALVARMAESLEGELGVRRRAL